jgi:hypothetical protein
MRVLEGKQQQQQQQQQFDSDEDVNDDRGDDKEANKNGNEDDIRPPVAATAAAASNVHNTTSTPLPVASEVEPPPELLKRMRELEEKQNAVPHATPVEENDNDVANKQKHVRRLWILAMSTIVIILAIVLGTVLGIRSNKTTSTDPTPSPTLSSESVALLSLIESVSFDGGEALQNASSPQSQALEWLQQGINNTIEENWRLIQRYVLAVLYYSTSGDTWLENANWLSETSECTWYTDALDPICDENGRFLRIVLLGNNLQGTVPNELALLSDSLCKYILFLMR